MKRSQKKKSKTASFGRSNTQPKEETTTTSVTSQLFTEPVTKTSSVSSQPLLGATSSSARLQSEPLKETVITARKLSGPIEKTYSSVSRLLGTTPVEEVSTSVSQLQLEPTEDKTTDVVRLPCKPVEETTTITRRLVNEPIEETTLVSRSLTESPGKGTKLVKQLISEPTKEITSSVSEVFSEPVEKTVTTVRRSISGPAEQIDQQLIGAEIEGTVQAGWQLIGEPVEKTVTTYRQLSGEPIEKIDTTDRKVIHEPVGKTSTLARQVSSESVGKTSGLVRQVSSESVGKASAVVRQVSREPAEKSSTIVKEFITKPVEETASLLRQVNDEPIEETATVTGRRLIGGPLGYITSSTSHLISKPFGKLTKSVSELISEPIEKTVPSVRRLSGGPTEKTTSTDKQLIHRPLEKTVSSTSHLISEPTRKITTSLGQLSTALDEKTTTAARQITGEPIEKTASTVKLVAGQPIERQLSSEPIVKTTTVIRQLVTEPTEKDKISVSQPVVKTTPSVRKLTSKFEEKRTSVSRELMSEPAKETSTLVAELHLEPAERSTTPTVQVPSEPIGNIPQSVRPRTVTSKKKSAEVKSLEGKESISQVQPASERTSLLASSFEIHPGVSYGGIAASFAGHPEGPSSTEFLMSSEGGLVWSEEELKRKIKYFFMNPIEKWRAKRKFPWKLLLQVVKIIFVTVQLCVFGSDGYIYELQKQNTGTSFNHMFLKDWTALRDVVSYPPSTGAYAVYTKPEFYGNVDHVVKTYANITNIALGTYGYDGPNATMTYISFCRIEFKKMLKFNQSVVFDSQQNTICHKIPDLYPEGDPRWKQFSIQRYLDEKNDTVSFDKMITANITFSLKTIFLKSLGNNKYPDCYRFDIEVLYSNKEHDGQVLVGLETKAEKLECYHNGSMNPDDKWSLTLRQVLNGFIIFICVLSLLLCCRCLAKGRYLCRETNKYFKFSQNQALTTQEKMEFLDMWYCAMIFNDALIIAASILKAAIEQRTVESDQYATCAILLGVGNLLVWAGVLRYLGFFSKYNILILTMKKAIPNVLRFILCCVLLYAGFCFCGWVVLGPYHIKFRSLSSTSECLFAMMNGDDLFATFAITNTDNDLIWWFSRIYLYTFISMFIYVVISLFISVIMDSYETVKDHYRNGNTMTRIQVLLADIPEDSCSSFYQQRRKQQKTGWQWIVAYFRK